MPRLPWEREDAVRPIDRKITKAKFDGLMIAADRLGLVFTPTALELDLLDIVHATEAQPIIRMHRAWNKYRADCSCGWVGSYLPTREQVAAEHTEHIKSEKNMPSARQRRRAGEADDE